MKEAKEAERILSGRYRAPAARALGIVRRLQQAASDGDMDAADLRVRLVNHLVREGAEGLEVLAQPEGIELHVGERGTPCPVRREELEPATADVLRERHGIDVGPIGEPIPEGLSVRQPSAAVLAVAAGLDGKACLTRATEAMDAYDLDAALGYLRLAVARTRGDRDAVGALARFLVETYAYYDEAIELLSSPRINAAGTPALARPLADARFRLGQWAAARAGYEGLTKGSDDRGEVRRRAATCALELGDAAGALNHLAEADRAEPGDPRNAELRARAQKGAEGALVEALAGARAALQAGDLAAARTQAEAVRARGLEGAELARVLRDIEAARRAAQTADLKARAAAARERGDERDAATLLRQAHELLPQDEALAGELQQLEQALARREVADQLAKGDGLSRAGDVPGALRAWYRAVTVADDLGGLPPDASQDPLLARLVDYLAHERPKHVERAFEGLAALWRSEAALTRGEAHAALSAAEDAARLLRGYPPVDAAVTRARDQVNASDRAQAHALLTAVSAAEARGDLDEAIARMEEVVALVGTDFEGAGDRRKALRETQERDRRARELLSRVRKLLEERNGFRALQVLEQAGGEIAGRADAAALVAEARQAIAEQFPVTPRAVSGPPPLPGAVPSFDAARLGVGQLSPKDVRVVADEEGDRILLLTGSLLVVLRAEDLRVEAAVDLPDSIPFGDEGDAMFTADVGGTLHVLFVRNGDRTLTRVEVSGGTGQVTARVDLGGSLGSSSGTARSYAYDAPSGNLLVLELTRRAARQESRFLALDTTDGRLRFRETYNQPLFNLQPLRGGQRYTATRVADGHARMSGSWYHLALLDARGKLQERIVLNGMDEDPYALRQTVRGPSSDRVFCEYWGFDQFTGQVRTTGGSLLVLRKDWSVFFQSANPDLILGGDRHAYGSMGVTTVDGEERLLLPWREADGKTGVAVLDAAHMRCIGHVAMDEGVHLGAVRADARRGRAHVVTFASGKPGFRVDPLDVAAAR